MNGSDDLHTTIVDLIGCKEYTLHNYEGGAATTLSTILKSPGMNVKITPVPGASSQPGTPERNRKGGKPSSKKDEYSEIFSSSESDVSSDEDKKFKKEKKGKKGKKGFKHDSSSDGEEEEKKLEKRRKDRPKNTKVV